MSVQNSSSISPSNHLMSFIALTGICTSLVGIIAISIVGATVIPCGVILLGTPLFQAMMLLSVLLTVSISLLVSSTIKIYQENKN